MMIVPGQARARALASALTRPAGALLLAAVASAPWLPGPEWAAVAGRMHPMLVHFPIGLLLAAAGLEALRALLRRPGPSPSARTCLLLGTLGALVAAGSGWLYAEHDPPGRAVEDALFWHRWSGVASAVLASVALVLCARCRPGEVRGPVRAYRIALLVTGACVAGTGHLGGELVYGEGYVLEPLTRAESAASRGVGTPPAQVGEGPPPLADAGGAANASADLGEGADTSDGAGTGDGAGASDGAGTSDGAGPVADVGVDARAPDVPEFTRDLQGLFEQRCFSCHGPSKQRGDLRLDLGADLFAGDRAEWVIVPGNAAASPVYTLVTLPAWDPDIMPNEGDPLAPDEIDLIRRWIDAGARWDGVDVPAPDR